MQNESETTTPKLEVPAWVNHTPPEPWYMLEMFEHGESVDQIEMSRAEYIALKRHLAEMRGLPAPEDDEKGESVPSAVHGPDLQTIIVEDVTANERGYLETCQEIYRNNQGCMTPAENFFVGMVEAYTVTNGGLTPETAEHLFNEFKEDFPSAIEAGRLLVEHYPKLVTGPETVANAE